MLSSTLLECCLWGLVHDKYHHALPNAICFHRDPGPVLTYGIIQELIALVSVQGFPVFVEVSLVLLVITWEAGVTGMVKI